MQAFKRDIPVKWQFPEAGRPVRRLFGTAFDLTKKEGLLIFFFFLNSSPFHKVLKIVTTGRLVTSPPRTWL